MVCLCGVMGFLGLRAWVIGVNYEIHVFMVYEGMVEISSAITRRPML